MDKGIQANDWAVMLTGTRLNNLRFAMLKYKTIEATVIEAARLSGHELSGQEKLLIRTGVSASLAAKERHRQRMSTSPYQWKKPARPRC